MTIAMLILVRLVVGVLSPEPGLTGQSRIGLSPDSLSRTTLNRVAVTSVEQEHAIRSTVDNDGKNVQNVAAEHADIQYFLLQAGRIGAAKRNPLTVVTL